MFGLGKDRNDDLKRRMPRMDDVVVSRRRITPRPPAAAEDEEAPKREENNVPRARNLKALKRTESERIDSAVEEFFGRSDSERPKARPTKSAAPAPSEATRGARTKIVLWAAGALVLLGGAAVLLTTVFARVSLSLVPNAESVVVNPIAMRVTPDIMELDIGKGIIPGELIELSLSKSAEVHSSAKRVVNERARGAITITNNFSDQPQVLVASTRFAAADGKVFRLEKSITVPGATKKNGVLVPSTIDATVVASEPGEAYNIGPTKFTIPGFQGTPRYQGFTAESKAAFSGGFQGESAVITSNDIKQASEQVTADLFNELKDALNTKIPQGFVVIEGAREVAITGVEVPAAGSRAERATVTAAGKVRAIAYREKDEHELLAKLLGTSSPMTFIAEESSIERSATSLDFTKKELRFTVSGEARLGATFDQAAIREGIAGKEPGDIASLLKGIPGIQAYTIKFFPFWLGTAPSDESKIRISIEPFRA